MTDSPGFEALLKEKFQKFVDVYCLNFFCGLNSVMKVFVNCKARKMHFMSSTLAVRIKIVHKIISNPTVSVWII